LPSANSFGAGLLQSFPGLKKFRLFDTVGGQKRDAPAG
jgi:hypothetical protein